jgi:hypothetical protein
LINLYFLLASNTLDPTNLTRSDSRNTIGPSFKLQFDGALNHLLTAEDDKKKITDQVCCSNKKQQFNLSFL